MLIGGLYPGLYSAEFTIFSSDRFGVSAKKSEISLN